MLVLTRKRKQTIMIGDNIRVMIVAVKGGAVKVAIEAPADLKVMREEIYQPKPAEPR